MGNKNIENSNFAYSAKCLLDELRNILNLGVSTTVSPSALEMTLELRDPEIKIKIDNREKARKEGNYALADKIRKELEEKGFKLKDTKKGTKIIKKL